MAEIDKTPGNRCFQWIQPVLVFSYIAHGYIIFLCINIHGVLVVDKAE